MSRRRGLLALGALAIFACYTVHMDEAQIRTIASQDMDCDEQLVQLETGSSDHKDVARYVVRGCEKVRTYLCVTDTEGRVHCDNAYKKAAESSSDGDDGVATGVAVAAAGCACASLFASHSSDPSSSTPASNPNPSTPQRNR